MTQDISETLLEQARRLYAQRGIILPPALVQVSLRNLAKLFQQLNRGGHLLTDSTGTPAFCSQCGAALFSTESYTVAKAGNGPTLFSCEHCVGDVKGGAKQ